MFNLIHPAPTMRIAVLVRQDWIQLEYLRAVALFCRKTQAPPELIGSGNQRVFRRRGNIFPPHHGRRSRKNRRADSFVSRNTDSPWLFEMVPLTGDHEAGLKPSVASTTAWPNRAGHFRLNS